MTYGFLRCEAVVARLSAKTSGGIQHPKEIVRCQKRRLEASLPHDFTRSTPTRAPCRWRASRLSRRTPPARSETVDRRALESACLEAVGSSLAYSMSRRTLFPAG